MFLVALDLQLRAAVDDANLERILDLFDIFVTEFTRCIADKTTKCANVNFYFCGKLALCDFAFFHQILQTLSDVAG